MQQNAIYEVFMRIFLLINTVQPALGQDVAQIAEIRIDKTIAEAMVIQY